MTSDIPHDEEQLRVLIEGLPTRLQTAVILWCRGQDPAPFLSGMSSSTCARDSKLLAARGIAMERPHPAPFASPPPPPPKLRYYSVRVLYADDVPFHVFALNEHRDLFLSPLGRLAGFEKRAEVHSHLLAAALADHCLPRLRKRYGAGVELEVGEWHTSPNAKAEVRVLEDSKRAEAYLARSGKVRSSL